MRIVMIEDLGEGRHILAEITKDNKLIGKKESIKFIKGYLKNKGLSYTTREGKDFLLRHISGGYVWTIEVDNNWELTK